ncbi:unnamed protein product, partial [Phaeothamnion confervicola]
MFAARVLLRARKTATGLTGLAVDPNARANLIKVQQQVLEKIKIIPAGVAYRDAVEKTFSYRLKVAQDAEDEDKIEEEIGMGAPIQLEELIDEAK